MGEPLLIMAANVLGRLRVGREAECSHIVATDLFVNVQRDTLASDCAWAGCRRRRLNRRAEPLLFG